MPIQTAGPARTAHMGVASGYELVLHDVTMLIDVKQCTCIFNQCHIEWVSPVDVDIEHRYNNV